MHIFNPSSFPLAVFSLVLLATGTSGITWGQEIASTQFYPPHMYLMLFLLGLPGQILFGVTSMTMSAVVATYVFGLLYFAATGIYFFYDSYIPIAVFLGMHLLFNDPSTSPRTELGRIIFGALYGLSTVALYQLLGSAGMPTFYDKLLQVPLLNLSIKRHRSAGALQDSCATRSRCAWPVAESAPAQSGVHVDLGDRVCGDERRKASATAIPASGCRSGGTPARMDVRMPAPTLPIWSRASAIGDRAGRATRPGSCISRCRGRARIFAGPIPREPRSRYGADASSGLRRPAGT